MTNNQATLYIIRHGQTDWNIGKKIQGHTDIPLNDEGIMQAQNLNEKLKGIKFDAAYSSDLLRARQTAEIAIRELNVALLTTEKLRERCFGELEGQATQLLFEFEKACEAMSENEKRNHKHNPRYESDEEVISRVITFMREIAVAYPGKTVLLSTHGGIIRLLLIHLGLITINQVPLIENGCFMKLTSDGVDFFVDELHGIDIHKKFEH